MVNAGYIVWKWQDANNGAQYSAIARGIASLLQTSLRFKSCNCYNQDNLTIQRHLHFAKLRSTFSQA